MIQTRSTRLADVILVRPSVYRDERGLFFESFNAREFEAALISSYFVQDNCSVSKRGVLRGLHYQIGRPQGKLVRATKGKIFDVAVDIRRGSPTFGQHVSVELDADEFWSLWVPPGFAHGFQALTDSAEVSYKVTDYYAPEYERTLLWSDSVLGIQWPLLPPTLSAKDAAGSLMSEAELFE